MGEAADVVASMKGQPDAEREAALRAVAEKNGLKPGDLFMGLRVAITGATASPPLLPSIDAVGTEPSVRRIKETAALLVAVR
jgi:glutamyl/glutaminyl-tRNA synthetase